MIASIIDVRIELHGALLYVNIDGVFCDVLRHFQHVLKSSAVHICKMQYMLTLQVSRYFPLALCDGSLFTYTVYMIYEMSSIFCAF